MCVCTAARVCYRVVAADYWRDNWLRGSNQENTEVCLSYECSLTTSLHAHARMHTHMHIHTHAFTHKHTHTHTMTLFLPYPIQSDSPSALQSNVALPPCMTVSIQLPRKWIHIQPIQTHTWSQEVLRLPPPPPPSHRRHHPTAKTKKCTFTL